MKIKYKFKEVYPKVFLITMDNPYDLAMTFCRVQEYYESPYKEIRGKSFTITELQRIYSMRKGDGCFTYPIDWAGYNVPSNIIHQLYYSDKIQDKNQYDNLFYGILNRIGDCIEYDDKYYVIGSDPENKDTINHELSHAFYYLYPDYKKQANKIIDKIPKGIFNKLKKTLFDLGYDSNVIKDEIQAYLANDYYTITQDVNLGGKQKNIIDNIKKELKVLNSKMHE